MIAVIYYTFINYPLERETFLLSCLFNQSAHQLSCLWSS